MIFPSSMVLLLLHKRERERERERERGAHVVKTKSIMCKGGKVISSFILDQRRTVNFNTNLFL